MNNDVRNKDRDRLTGSVIGCAIEVHRAMGPGLLETVYETCLAHEFGLRNVPFERQVHLPLIYKGCHLRSTFRLDFLVDRDLIIELKAVDRLLPVHAAQLLSYMRLSGVRKGLLLNFNTDVLRDGIKRLVL
ncbi:MAG: GxxExxY protein [Rhodospirillales bacterium]|nr:GxxExxY protein [Rhodospirillales bacterium]